ncbi:EH domain-containing protein 1 [Trichoplax sp. H2]|uniref:EH domain-containing protein n=1 Tax=Trichoplax adhaerens TaxID=10228 RepID=B3RY77_TRIAD|nr:hypothetical protein TRIADDRAFT_25492 [Trichoplax adhaerens]EDV24986.1 hypothetical protein TRIADDRAFT_25492 [Trichoplax adhaerens]RDD45873.1 EH domain-containing protein 1 [Trichoplax sp. H2]|eukprot:XP_002112876.1 hypothetical protein TRIADDRAFT_25492 [Trichoplax adhaerens]
MSLNETREVEALQRVMDELQKVYKNKVLPLEEYYNFDNFDLPPMGDKDFNIKPTILLVGEYSTGKTTFIKYLLSRGYPGMKVSPEPSTDNFCTISYGENDKLLPGHALVSDPSKDYRALGKFGNNLLDELTCIEIQSSVVENLTIIDSPGILSDMSNVKRGYDFPRVIDWFAEHADRIVLLFDAQKLEVGDEMKAILDLLTKNIHKVRIVLNKSDLIDYQQLFRVYGALMFYLGKIIPSRFVPRVYIGSFWDEPFSRLSTEESRQLLEAEKQDLLEDLRNLPRDLAMEKLDYVIKRSRLVRCHAHLIAYLKKEMPSIFRKQARKDNLIFNLSDIYFHVEEEYRIPRGDFPPIEVFQKYLRTADFSKFQTLKPKLIEIVDRMLLCEIPILKDMALQASSLTPAIRGGAFGLGMEGPFSTLAISGVDIGANSPFWAVRYDKSKYDKIFYSLNPIEGRISSDDAKNEMMKSKLPNSVLGKIWVLADHDGDNLLDDEEFALALYLIKLKLDGCDLPAELPRHLIPPSQLGLDCAEGKIKYGIGLVAGILMGLHFILFGRGGRLREDEFVKRGGFHY